MEDELKKYQAADGDGNEAAGEAEDKAESKAERETGDETADETADGTVKEDEIEEDWDADEEISLEDFQAECERIREANDEYLDLFEADMKEKGLSEATVRRHLSNVNFYLNTFLLSDDIISMEEGWGYIGEFLGNFFIRKCMWSTPATIKSTAASLKKFYRSMAEYGKVEQADYKEMCEIIKSEMEDWQENCRLYNDPTEENPFGFWGF